MFMTPKEARLTYYLLVCMFLVAVIMAANNARAYVPNSYFVFDKTASLHGRGPYYIETEVIFQDGMERLSLKEEWIIEDGAQMHVQVSGNRANLHKLLYQNRVYWVDPAGNEIADPEPESYFMGPLLTKTPKTLKRKFINWGVIPQRFLNDQKKVADLKYIQNQPETFVRLSRVSGSIAWAYGTPSTDTNLLPGLWIEQDTYFIKKIRAPDGSTIITDDYSAFPRGLSFPKSQTYLFDGKSVTVFVKQVKGITLTETLKKSLFPSWFRSHPEAKTVWPQSPLLPIVQEFYKKFR